MHEIDDTATSRRMDRIGFSPSSVLALDASIHGTLALMADWVRGCTHARSDVSGSASSEGTQRIELEEQRTSSSQRALSVNWLPPEKYETIPVKDRMVCPRFARGLKRSEAAASAWIRDVRPEESLMMSVKSFWDANAEYSLH